VIDPFHYEEKIFTHHIVLK